MITPTYTMQVDDTKLMLHVDALPIALRKNLKATISELTNQLLTQVIGREPMRTGLLRSRTRAFVDDNENGIRGRVRILGTGRAQQTAAAFGALEYGAHRRFGVGSYRRGESIVSAYQRTANIRARRFLRDPLAAMAEQATAQIEAAVDKSVAEANAT